MSRHLRMKERLVRFYQVYNPAKLGTVAATLTRYAGNERQLFANLVLKYGAEPPATVGPPPKAKEKKRPPVVEGTPSISSLPTTSKRQRTAEPCLISQRPATVALTVPSGGRARVISLAARSAERRQARQQEVQQALPARASSYARKRGTIALPPASVSSAQKRARSTGGRNASAGRVAAAEGQKAGAAGRADGSKTKSMATAWLDRVSKVAWLDSTSGAMVTRWGSALPQRQRARRRRGNGAATATAAAGAADTRPSDKSGVT